LYPLTATCWPRPIVGNKPIGISLDSCSPIRFGCLSGCVSTIWG
jgi:hypothetical protein